MFFFQYRKGLPIRQGMSGDRVGLTTSALALAGLAILHPAELDGETKKRDDGCGIPSGLRVGHFVSLTPGRLQNTCQVGTEGGEEFCRVCEIKLDSHYYSLRDAEKNGHKCKITFGY